MPSFTNGLLDPRGVYTIYRTDRKYKIGGGVIIFVSNILQSSPIISIYSEKFSAVEIVGCKGKGSDTFSVYCYYCPPNNSNEYFFLSINYFKSINIFETCLWPGYG